MALQPGSAVFVTLGEVSRHYGITIAPGVQENLQVTQVKSSGQPRRILVHSGRVRGVRKLLLSYPRPAAWRP